MASIHEFQVDMSCEGCSGAVKRVLDRLGDKVNKIDIDLTKQRVYVESDLPSEELLATIKKTGKTCSYIGVKS